jgi:hypothetical protein
MHRTWLWIPHGSSQYRHRGCAAGGGLLIRYRKADGSQSAKVFKISTLTLAPGETRSLFKRHAFRQMTIRVHYPGLHALVLQINVALHGHAEFLLKTG